MVTALSASGPAYVFLFIEALIDAGVYMGLQRPIGKESSFVQTVIGRERQVRSGDGNAPGGAKGHCIVARGRYG